MSGFFLVEKNSQNSLVIYLLSLSIIYFSLQHFAGSDCYRTVSLVTTGLSYSGVEYLTQRLIV